LHHANIIEDNGKIWLTKICNEHGPFQEVLFHDINLYKKWMKFKVNGNPVSFVKKSFFTDPELYTEHLSQSMLTNLMITNRYNFPSKENFYDANITNYVYEPSLKQIRGLIQQIKIANPSGLKAIQISGGEPTLRDDLFEIIRIVKGTGFSHIQLHTDGLKLAESIDYCQSLKNAQINTIYLKLKGITKTTNPLLDVHQKTIENCKKINLPIVLNPFIQDEKTLKETGKIIRFAITNNEIVKGIHFELDFSNNLQSNENKKHYQNGIFVFENFFQYIEQEFPEIISRDDFYPYCFTYPISKFIEIITNDNHMMTTAHPTCGGSTFIFLENGKPIPLTHFIDVESFMEFLTDQSKKKGPLRKLRIASAFMKSVDTFVDYNKAPKGFNPKQILKDATILGSEYALRDFRKKTLFIGFMNYQNISNLDIDRLKRCVIYSLTLDGILPYCSLHTLGQGDVVLKKFSIPVQEWEKQTHQSNKNDLHH
jgi:uncharacterized radical SAM superfamily Fe-S cluster-containing enzyme